MATLQSSQAPRASPHIKHSYEGDQMLQNYTFERRMKIKGLLVALQDDIQKLLGDGSEAQIVADIQIKVKGHAPYDKENRYHVSVDQTKEGNGELGNTSTALNASQPVQAPAAPMTGNGVAATQSPDPLAAGETSQNPRKRMRSDTSDQTSAGGDDDVQVISSRKNSAPVPVPLSGSIAPQQFNELLKFLIDWREQWREQGGWMFDHFTKLYDEERRKKAWMEKKIDGIQNTLGASLNYQNAQTMQELSGISKMLPWLENCRKTAADFTQAREEKWRTSSANFHDQNRRDREAAEKKIMEAIEKQQQNLEAKVLEALEKQQQDLAKHKRMLTQLMESQGLDDES